MRGREREVDRVRSCLHGVGVVGNVVHQSAGADDSQGGMLGLLVPSRKHYKEE